MKTFLVLICTLALVCAAGGAQEEKESKKPAPKKQQAQLSQHPAAPSGGDADLRVRVGIPPTTTAGKPSPRNLTTNAKPSSEITANAAPPSFVGRSSGVAKQTGAGAGSPAVQLHKFSDTTVKPATVGRPMTVGALATSPAPKSAVWSHNAGSLKNLPNVKPSGASQGQGKPAKASKNNDQRATPEYHKVWQDGKLRSHETATTADKSKTKKGGRVSPTPIPR